MNKVQNNLFKAYYNQQGLLQDLLDNEFPAQLYAWDKRPIAYQKEGTSFFGFVYEGQITLTCLSGTFQLSEGMYFCVPNSLTIEGEGKGILIEQQAFKALFQIGGPIEPQGRLQYIDGCTDSLLIAPPMMGNPCLNLLNIPANTFQSQHTHPSFRIGMIVKGTGTCITPEGNSPLKPGVMFVIPENALHSFKTATEDLLIIAYHPDSDFGPTHENHPMINRTILN